MGNTLEDPNLVNEVGPPFSLFSLSNSWTKEHIQLLNLKSIINTEKNTQKASNPHYSRRPGSSRTQKREVFCFGLFEKH